MRIDDRNLDEALRTIAAAPVPANLPARVLDAIHEEAPSGWLRGWLPAVGALAAVVLLAVVTAWMHTAPREAQGTGRTAQGTAPQAQGARPTAQGTAPEAQGAGLIARGSGGSHPRTLVPTHPRTSAPSAPQVLQSSSPTAHGSEDEVPLLDPPEPLTIARLQMPELPEQQLRVNALHIPALEVETLER